MLLRKLTKTGIARFREYRDNLSTDRQLPPPRELLEDNNFTVQVSSNIDVPLRPFSNRLEAGSFLVDLLEKARIEVPEKDAGLWAWLTLYFFDEVCPADSKGNRAALATERLIPLVDNYQRFYRHLLLGPFLVVRAYRANPAMALSVLCTPVWKPGEIVGQLAARKELVTNHAVIELATRLYYDETSKGFVRGAGGSTKGASRRLAAVLNQFSLTYYLQGMKSEEILLLLPKEFDRFKRRVA